jgi:branched-chain amino acid transport system permease protein
MDFQKIGREFVFAVVAIAILLMLPAMVSSAGLLDFLIRVSIFSIFALSLNLLVGNTGLVSFGHGIFMGSGAYSFGILMQSYSLSVPMGALIAVLISTGIAVFAALACSRLSHIYFSFLTLAIQMLFHAIILSWSSLTGGDQGLLGGVPRPPFLGINLTDPVHLYRTALCVFFVAAVLMRVIVVSPFGNALRLIRDNEARATAIGIEVSRYKFAIFVIAGMFGSVAGVLLCIHNSGAFPEFAYWTISGDGIFMVMLGGAQTYLGPVVGAVMLLLMNDLVTSYTSHYGIFLGLVILATVLGLRKGLLDYVMDYIANRDRGTKDTKDPEAPLREASDAAR